MQKMQLGTIWPIHRLISTGTTGACFATMQNQECFLSPSQSIDGGKKQTEKATEVLKKAEQVMGLKKLACRLSKVFCWLVCMSENGPENNWEKFRFQNLAKSLEEGLKYYSSFPSNQKESILDDAGYQLSLYNELIKQAADTLPEAELKSMKEKLMVFAGKLE